MNREPTKEQFQGSGASTSSSVEQRIGKEYVISEVTKNRVRKALFYVWTIIGLCVLCGIFIYLLRILALPVSVLIWTMIFVFCLRGVVHGLEDKGINRLAGTTIAYVLMFAVLAAVGFLMFSPAFGLSEQFANIASSVPGYVESIVGWSREIYEDYSSFLNNETVKSAMASMGDSLTSWASGFAGSAANAAVDLGVTIANSVTAIGFALVIAFWVLLELPAAGREMNRILPQRYAEEATFFHVTFTRILGGYLKGTLIQCFIIGVACGILFAIAGIPNAPALGVITGVLNIIPIVGPWLGGAVAAITAVFVSPIVALIALLGTIIIQQFVYTFVSPKIMSNSVDIHPALTLVAMIFGSAIGGAMGGVLGGIVGMLFAIPAVAVMKACFVYFFERKTGRQVISADGFMFKGTPSADGKVNPFQDATGPNPSKKSKKHKKGEESSGAEAAGSTSKVKEVLHKVEADAKEVFDRDVCKDAPQDVRTDAPQDVRPDAASGSESSKRSDPSS